MLHLNFIINYDVKSPVKNCTAKDFAEGIKTVFLKYGGCDKSQFKYCLDVLFTVKNNKIPVYDIGVYTETYEFLSQYCDTFYVNLENLGNIPYVTFDFDVKNFRYKKTEGVLSYRTKGFVGSFSYSLSHLVGIPDVDDFIYYAEYDVDSLLDYYTHRIEKVTTEPVCNVSFFGNSLDLHMPREDYLDMSFKAYNFTRTMIELQVSNQQVRLNTVLYDVTDFSTAMTDAHNVNAHAFRLYVDSEYTSLADLVDENIIGIHCNCSRFELFRGTEAFCRFADLLYKSIRQENKELVEDFN